MVNFAKGFALLTAAAAMARASSVDYGNQTQIQSKFGQAFHDQANKFAGNGSHPQALKRDSTVVSTMSYDITSGIYGTATIPTYGQPPVTNTVTDGKGNALTFTMTANSALGPMSQNTLTASGGLESTSYISSIRMPKEYGNPAVGYLQHENDQTPKFGQEINFMDAEGKLTTIVPAFPNVTPESVASNPVSTPGSDGQLTKVPSPGYFTAFTPTATSQSTLSTSKTASQTSSKATPTTNDAATQAIAKLAAYAGLGAAAFANL